MLLELCIKDFALLDSVNISFSRGLNVLTGETGAGKSILIDSVNFILGEKQTKDIIRTGQECAYVEGIFESNDQQLIALLNENGINCDGLLVISREINGSGRSISRINGRTVTISILKQVSKLLIDIHGQHEHQSLLNEDKHIDILDTFCEKNFSDIKKDFAKLYNELKNIESQIQKVSLDEQYKLRRMDLLNFQIKEIEESELSIGEDEQLLTKRDVMANAQKIYATLSMVYQKLYEGQETESAYDEVGSSIAQMEYIEKYDDNLKNIKASLEDIYYKLEDVVGNVRDFKDNIEYDSALLDEIEMRIDLINMMKRKYGNTIQDILTYYDDIKLELTQIQRSEELLNELEVKKEAYTNKLTDIAQNMTIIRKEAGANLKIYIERELKYLGMEKSIFEAKLDKMDNLTLNGQDKVAFVMTANPGEPLRALSKIASGGEMSRIMLAIKSVIADIDKIPTLIFDEIDTGISGRTAQAVAEKMSIISHKHQILCVTHLAQIAAMADSHLKIEKNTKYDKTVTNVYNLDRCKQIDEIARILGGTVITELTKNTAKEMIELAQGLKEQIR